MYHYTDSKGLSGILQSGVIKPSIVKGKDAFFGEGVYLTALLPLHPNNGKETILKNNYDNTGNGHFYGYQERADCYVKFKISDLKGVVQKRQPFDGKNKLNRDVWVYPGAIELKYYQHWYSHDRFQEVYQDCTEKELDPSSDIAIRPPVSLIDWDGLEENEVEDSSSEEDTDDDNEDFEIITAPTPPPRGERSEGSIFGMMDRRCLTGYSSAGSQNAQMMEESSGIEKVLRVGATVAAIGIGIATVFGVLRNPINNRQH